MWTTKTFLTKTKRGNILKIVREHYLRDDLLCGSAACNVCPHKNDELVLEANPESICALFDYPHYVVLDTNVVLHQIDVLEEDALKNVIILQTVLEEVKHQNTAIFQRLLEIVGNNKRRFYSFVNEHHQDTYIERQAGEKQNDRNDRAIRKAAAWYEAHLSINGAGKIPRIVLLTDDEKNRKLAQEENIVCCTVKDYVENVTNCIGLVDKLSKNVMPESCSKDALYPAHLTPVQIHEGIRGGKLHQGTFHASRDNFLEGNATVSGFEKQILLQGHIGINRAVDGDVVAIEILPEEEWRRPSDIVLEDKAEDDPGDVLQEEAVLLSAVKPVDPSADEVTPTGRVVGIIRRKWRQYCGILMPSKFPGATRHLFTPAEKRIPRVRIETRQSDVLAAQRIVVALDSWPRNSRYPLGHFVRALGPIGDKDAENEVILLEHDVPHARFSEAVLACLPPADWTIPKEVGVYTASDKDAENEVILLEHDVPHARFSEAVLACLPPADWTIPKEVGVYTTSDKDAENEVILLEHDVPHARFSEAVLACLPPADWTIPKEVGVYTASDKDAENEVILLEHDVPHARFSEAVLACLPPADWTIPKEVGVYTASDKDAENEVILLEHDVPHARFSEAVLACLPPADWTIPKEVGVYTASDKDAENEVILLEHDVPHARFSEAVLACLPPADWTIPKEVGVYTASDKDAENEVILLEHDVPHARFSEAVLACLPPADWTIPKEVGVYTASDKDAENEVILLEHDVPHARFSEAVLACLPPADWTIPKEVGVYTASDKDAENEVILLEHDVPHARFSEAVLACLPPADWTIPKEERAKRVDLRGITICSVDPPGCTDIDDALHARPIEGLTPQGLKKFEVGVHIADVTYFVRPNTALDKEAASRSTTVYLVDRRIDMVPDLLSSNLCSLRGGEERLAFSCVWEIDENANIISTKFHKSVIKSAAAMTYEEAQIAIDDSSRDDTIAQSLRTLNSLAKKLKRRRMDNGALLLASPEIRFQVDSETHDPIEVQAKKIVDTNSMVEEFMLLANISVAEKLAAEFPQCAMLRRHPAPPANFFTDFLKAAKQQGFELDVSTNKAFSKSLDQAVIPSRPYFNTLLRIMATRCMQQAVYFSSGTRARDDFYHYGLACPIYTHFTSPIRRYADVIVHRLLAACIGCDVTHPTLLDTKFADSLCDNLNYRHRQAQHAGRASVALNTHILFKNRVEVEAAVVLAVKRNAVQVLIPKYGLEGPIYLPSDMFTYNEEEHVQKCGDKTLKTFDELTVRLSLDSTNLQHRKLVFQLIEPHIPGFSYVPEENMETDQVDQKTTVTQKTEEPKTQKRKETVPTRKDSKKKNKKK